MKHSLFWAAVEAGAKTIRSGLSVVGALVDCGIPRQHAGEQWLKAFEEENECLEAPLSADFDDEPAAYFCNQCGPRGQEDVDHCNYLRCRVVESQAIAQQLQAAVLHAAASATPKTPAAGANGAVEDLPGGVPPTPPGTDSKIPYRGEQLNWCEYVQPAVFDVLADHIYEFGFLTNCTCGTSGIFDWQDWREHVSPILAERLEAVTLALPEK